MKNILDKIIESKKAEVARRKIAVPVQALEQSPLFKRTGFSMAESIRNPDKTGIIAEFKRKSPSKGVINEFADVSEITGAYTKLGASGLSVLTDTDFFGGSDQDLARARENDIPILRKEFIIDEYQVVEAKAIGADTILLIAACLSPGEVKQLARLANTLGMEVLLEIHSEEELDHITGETLLIGINNRDLRTFRVDLERSLRLAGQIPPGKVKIAESGIRQVEDLLLFREHGYEGFLIGENFMKEDDPAIAFARFVEQLKSGKNAC